MSSIPAVNNAALDIAKAQNKTEKTGTGMDKDTFLKLLTAQLKYQDPMNPTDQTQQLAQLAQFSSLEQMTNLVSATKDLTAAAQGDSAVQLVGKTVTYKDEAGAVQTGLVEKVVFDKGVPTLTVGGKAGVLPGSVTEVA